MMMLTNKVPILEGEHSLNISTFYLLGWIFLICFQLIDEKI